MPRPIPPTGIAGEAALREAAASEFGEIAALVRRALELAIAGPNGNTYVSVEALFADRVVVAQDGRYWAYPYTLGEDNQVQLGPRAEVIESYVPVTTPMREAADTPEGHFVEAREVENIYTFCEALQKKGVVINRPPRDGHMAFIRSPDQISIEILQKDSALPVQEPWASMQNVGEW